MKADSADGLAVDLDREARHLSAFEDVGDVFPRAFFGVRMRETIAQILPDASVVPVLRQADGVLGPIRSNHAFTRPQIDHRCSKAPPITIYSAVQQPTKQSIQIGDSMP